MKAGVKPTAFSAACGSLTSLKHLKYCWEHGLDNACMKF